MKVSLVLITPLMFSFMNICIVKKCGSTKLIIAKGSKMLKKINSSRGAAVAYSCYIHKKSCFSFMCFAQCLAAQIIRFPLTFVIFFFQYCSICSDNFSYLILHQPSKFSFDNTDYISLKKGTIVANDSQSH